MSRKRPNPFLPPKLIEASAQIGPRQDKSAQNVPIEINPPIETRTGGITRLWKNQLIKEAASTIVEFSVVSLLLLTLIFAILDCSRALYFDHYVRYSAEEGARYAMVRGSTWKSAPCTLPTTESCTAASADVLNFVKSITPMGNDSSLSVNTTWTGQDPTGVSCSTNNQINSPGCVVQVQVNYNFNFVFPFLPKGTLVLASTSAMVISQ